MMEMSIEVCSSKIFELDLVGVGIICLKGNGLGVCS